MVDDVNIIHHLGVVTNDFQSLITQYERIGFFLTPLSIPRVPLTPGGPSESLGAGNRCAIFEENYLELLGVVDPERWGEITPEQRGPLDVDRVLRRYEGLHILHLGSDDLEQSRRRMIDEGLEPSSIRPFQRPVETPEGMQTMRAKSLSFPPGSTPEALVQVAQHETPELVLQPRYKHHPNGARALTGVVICTSDPVGVSDRYAKYTGQRPAKRGASINVNLGASRIVVTDPAHLHEVMPGDPPPVLPFLAGMIVAADLDAAGQHLRRAQVPFSLCGDDSLLVGRSEACGTSILFQSGN
jgi:hypothetical protein